MIVFAGWPGATLEETLSQVTERIEGKLQETRHLDRVRSYTTAGVTTMFVDLQQSTPPDEVPDIWYQVRKNIGDIRGTLPAGVVGPGIGRVRAHGGEEVEWIDGRLRIDGEPVDWSPPDVATATLDGLLLKVPEGHVLVEPLDPAAGPWLVLPKEAVRGRAWAQHEPVWARRLMR